MGKAPREWRKLDTALRKKKKKKKKKVIPSPFGRVPLVFVTKYSHSTLCTILLSAFILKKGDCRSLAVAAQFVALSAKENKSQWHHLKTLDRMGPYGMRLMSFFSKSSLGTIRGHGAHVQKFCQWLYRSGTPRLEKVEIHHLIGFLKFEGSRHLSYSTLRSVVSSMTWMFALCDHDLATHDMLGEQLCLMERTSGRPPVQRSPITLKFIQRYHKYLVSSKQLAIYDCKLTLVAMTIAYLANCRGAQLRRAKWADLSMYSRSAGVAIFRMEHLSTKTSRRSDYTFSSFSDIPSLMGFSVTTLLWQIRATQVEQTPYLLGLPGLSTNGKPAKWVPFDSARQRYRYRKAAMALGYSEDMIQSFGSHSPRVGVATQAAMAGIDIVHRRVHGKWVKDSDMPTHYDASRHTIGALVSSILLARFSKIGKAPADLPKRVRALREDVLGLE
jgi:hypothetical protein